MGGNFAAPRMWDSRDSRRARSSSSCSDIRGSRTRGRVLRYNDRARDLGDPTPNRRMGDSGRRRQRQSVVEASRSRSSIVGGCADRWLLGLRWRYGRHCVCVRCEQRKAAVEEAAGSVRDRAPLGLALDAAPVSAARGLATPRILPPCARLHGPGPNWRRQRLPSSPSFKLSFGGSGPRKIENRVRAKSSPLLVAPMATMTPGARDIREGQAVAGAEVPHPAVELLDARPERCAGLAGVVLEAVVPGLDDLVARDRAHEVQHQTLGLRRRDHVLGAELVRFFSA